MEYKKKSMRIKLRLYILLILIWMLPSKFSYAQVDEKTKEGYSHSVYVIGRSYKDSIKLRWAPASPVAWHYANKYGYIVERYLIVKDHQALQIPEKVDLVKEPMKPLPLNEWEPYAETDDYAAISAQAIYGESFELTTNKGSDLMQMINKSRDLEARYSFALFSADVSPKVAHLSGLMLTDKDVKQGEQYLYKVIAKVPQDIIKIDTGYVYIGTNENRPLPKPRDLNAYLADKSALVSWEHRFNDLFYVAYSLERSDDGKLFKPVSDLPLINTRNDAEGTQDYMFRMDSLPENYKKYFYRVRGINSFGEYGPYSDTISGMGYKIFAANPAITSAKVMANQYVQINWEFPDSLNNLIKGFQVQRSGKDKGPYKDLQDTLLKTDERTFTDITNNPTNYYKVVAIDQRDEGHHSFPYIVLLIDSIPPKKPTGLVGEIDTTGIVTINWKQNVENDLLGYRVFRANNRSDEFSQITRDPISDNQSIDTINIRTLTKNVYYKISAVDQHFNPSEFSDILELKRPDKIPPVQPIFSSIESEENGIYLTWINSSSNDVSKHVLYRKSESDSLWNVIQLFDITDSITAFRDTLTIPGTVYQYTMLAVDETGLESAPSKLVTMNAFVQKIRPKVHNMKYKVDRDNKLIYLTWEYGYTGVERFLIYRSMNEDPINLYDGVSVGEFEYEDKRLQPNNKYSYRLKVLYKDGTQSIFSDKIEINY